MKLFSLWPKQLVHFACNSPLQGASAHEAVLAVA